MMRVDVLVAPKSSMSVLIYLKVMIASGLATIVLGWPQQNYMQVKNHICTLIDI